METKIPFYNLLNMFLIGLIFTGCCIVLFSGQVFAFVESDFFKSIQEVSFGLEAIITISFCGVIYGIGLVVNRAGSLLEDILKCIKAIPFDDDDKKFNERKAKFPIMSTLSREYALSRTSMTLFLLLAIISSVQSEWIFLIVVFVLTIIFYLSMRKFAGKIVKLMKD